MARTICLLTAALLLASTASAMPSLSLLPSDALPVAVPVDGTTGAASALDLELPASDLGETVPAEGADLLGCRAVVRIDLAAWAYDVTDSRERDSAFLTPFVTGVREVVRSVPVTETRTETIWAPGGLLGFLEPVTRTVTEVVGYDTETVEVPASTDLHVSLAWAEDHLDVTPLTETAYVSLPAGVPFLPEDHAAVVTLCDPDEKVLAHVPAIDCGGYDGCSPLPLSTGWYARLLDLDVRLAEAADEGLPFRDTRGWSIGGARLEDRIGQELGGLVPDGPAKAEPAPAPASGGAGQAEDVGLHSATASVHVPTQTALFVALAALLVAALATVGTVLVRMRR